MEHFTALTAAVLLGFIHLPAADTCDLYAAVGDDLNLPFVFNGLTARHVMKWTHNNTVVYLRQGDKVINGKANDVSPTGSLSLKNLQLAGAGIYQVNVSTLDNTPVTTWKRHLCVMEAVTKPQLSYVCDFKSGAVALNCSVTHPQALEFSWTLGKTILTRETRQTLSLPLGQLKGGSVTCAVRNKASSASSSVVQPACKSPTASPPAPVCLPFKTVVAVLAGGGGLVLVLLIIVIILCCFRRTKTQMTSGNNVQLRLASLNKQELGSIHPDYETMHTNEVYPCPSPKPSPRACNKSESEGATEKTPLQAFPAEEEQKPSPVPKPRTKHMQTPNV